MNNLENIITLSDSEGNEIDFEILDIFPYEGTDYAALLPLDDESDSPEVTILEVVHAQDEDSEDDQLCGLNDEALLSSVFNAFMERNKESFDFQ